jgi:hypothetical protein
MRFCRDVKVRAFRVDGAGASSLGFQTTVRRQEEATSYSELVGSLAAALTVILEALGGFVIGAGVEVSFAIGRDANDKPDQNDQKDRGPNDVERPNIRLSHVTFLFCRNLRASFPV